MCRHFLHPHLTLGKSFTQATFSSNFKLALISRLFKNPGLPKSDLANFRPISNLNAISKILERLAFHIFFLPFQISQFFLLYSLFTTKFILLRLLCLSSQMISWKPLIPEKLQFSLLWICPQPLILLDHITLLHRLQHTFDLSGFVISWIRSYLTDRSCFVKFDSSSSPSTTIPHRRASGRCFLLTTFCPFHITNCKCHKFWLVKPKIALCPSINMLMTLSFI